MKLSGWVCLMLVWPMAACSLGRSGEAEINSPAGDVLVPAANELISPTQPASPLSVETVQEGAPPIATSCPGEAANPIGQSIADEFSLVDYSEVMGWFCDGAAFEDIVVALQTAELTEASVEEMLMLIADGYTWEEIWFIVGLDE